MTKHRSKPGSKGDRGRGDSDGPNVTTMSDEDLLIHPEMVDRDNLEGMDTGFRSNACMRDGCSGQEMIDTMYENTSMDRVDNPREGTTPAPVDVVPGMLYPHRRT